MESNNSGHVLSYACTLFWLLFCLPVTFAGYWNNKWIVIERPGLQDELQRGIRGMDCYKEVNMVNIKCVQWDNPDKSEKIPPPLNAVLPPSTWLLIVGFIAKSVFLPLTLLVVYGILNCCSEKAAKLAKTHNRLLIGVVLYTVSCYFLTFLLAWILSMTEFLFITQPNESKQVFGTGAFVYSLGVIPLILGIYFDNTISGPIRDCYRRYMPLASASQNPIGLEQLDI